MKTKSLLFLVMCCLSSLLVHLKAETITYNFSSTEYWVTESNGSIHPETGTSALIQEIYYTENNDCFVGKGNVYFSSGYLMLKPDASLKIPYNANWIVNKVILHSHSGGSTSVKVNIYKSHDGISVSTALTWGKDADHEYIISENNRQSPLYVKVSNSNNARITSVTIDYTPVDGGNSDEGSTGEGEEESIISAPTFNPVSTSFNTESLKVTMDAAKECEIYYTTDGTTPSYTNAEEYNGTKGNSVTIHSSDSKVTLQAIAVDPATGNCSDVSSATYTYVAIENNGSATKPYTVAELRSMSYSTKEEGKWVKGTICGVLDGSNNLITSDFNVATNIAIGNKDEYVAIQLPNNTSIRNGVNLKDNPHMLGKEILVKGKLESYLMPKGVGVREPSDYKILYELSINSYGYSTLFLDIPVSVPDKSTAYYCITDDNYVELFPVGSVIPSNVGVIIESDPNTICSLTHTTISNSDEATILAENQLVGFIKETVVEADDYAYYALNVKDNKLGFYIPQTATDSNDAASGFTAKAYKAYLQVPANQKANMFIIHREGDESVIVPITQISDDTLYDLQGRIVHLPAAGIYIKNGKKIIIK